MKLDLANMRVVPESELTTPEELRELDMERMACLAGVMPDLPIISKPESGYEHLNTSRKEEEK